MRKVHTAESMLEIAHLRNLLETAGIACVVRNERLSGALGEIPFVECWPELWVREPGQALRARGLLDEALRPGPPAASWDCPSCGERIEGQFAQCWRCAAEPETGEHGP
jgi:Putative prokaryotic signal transducing protein